MDRRLFQLLRSGALGLTPQPAWPAAGLRMGVRAMVRPVDMQDNISKAPLVSREQHLQQSDAQIGQRQAAQDLSQQHILDHSRTRPAEQHDRVDLRLDDRERQRQDRGGEQQEPAPEETAVPPAQGEQAQGSDPSRRIDLIA